MLFIDTTALSVIQIIITSLVGIFGVAAALNGFLGRRISPALRVVICIAGLLMMDPGLVTDLIGIALFAAVVLWQYLGGRKATAA